MNCPICNGEMRIATEQIGVDNNNLPIFHRFAYCDVCRRKKDIDIAQDANASNAEQETKPPNKQVSEDMKRQLAKKELHKLDVDGNGTAYYIVAVGCIIGFFCSSSIGGLAGMFMLIFGIPCCIIFAIEGYKVNKRVKELRELANGKKIVNLCPRCKSQNIQMQMVQTGETTFNGMSRVSKNINPLHPFTHTNVRKGNEYNRISYGSQGHCLDCGFVFSKPDVLYM